MRVKFALTSLAFAAAIVAMPVVAFAGYAPANRATFQCITPTNCPGANYVTFNSFTNSSVYGDERGFFDARESGSTGAYQDQMAIRDGQKLELRVYIHNNANPNSIGVAAATAKNTRLQVSLPPVKKTANTAGAQVSASNANPGTVSDTVDFTGTNPFNLTFDRNAQIMVTYRPNGQGATVTRPLPGATFTNDQTMVADLGDFKGCFEFIRVVTVTAVVHMETPVTPTPTPQPAPQVKSEVKTLPNTGPGEIASLFAGASAVGAAGHYIVTRRNRR